jgi:putative membrane protein
MNTPTPAAGLSEATKQSVERTRLAHERTLMAWVRTSTSLISFGFTIYKFFQYLRENQQTAAGETTIGTRHFALIMIGIGITALILATAEHRRSMRVLRSEYGEDVVPYSLATIIAGLIALLGVFGLLAVAFRY